MATQPQDRPQISIDFLLFCLRSPYRPRKNREKLVRPTSNPGGEDTKQPPFYHASLIERPDAPSDQHAALPAMNHDDQGPLMCGSIAAALFSATAFTAARIYCSTVVLRRTRREDVVILVSLVINRIASHFALWAAFTLEEHSRVLRSTSFAVLTAMPRPQSKGVWLINTTPPSQIFLWASCILTILAVVSGMGKHVDTLTVEQRAGARFYYLVSVWPALLAITVPKVAVAGLIIRIFTPDIWTKTIMTAVVFVGIANYVVISALSTFMCVPLAAAWDPRVQPVRCVSAKIYLDLCYFTSSASPIPIRHAVFWLKCGS